MIFEETRLEVERIALAGGAGHEELHDTPGLRSEVRPGLRSGEQSLLIEETCQGDAAESAAELPEELTAIRVASPAMSFGIASHEASSHIAPGLPGGFAFPRQAGGYVSIDERKLVSVQDQPASVRQAMFAGIIH